MNNKKGGAGLVVGITLGAVLLIAIILVAFVAGNYNTLVNKDVSVENQWGKVQSSYERRLDLLPNLARTVKGSSDFEKETLTAVAQARGGIRLATNPTQIEEANRPVMSMMAGMMTYAEQYPNIKSTDLYKGLIDELAGTENRIKWDRDEYNDKVMDYQKQVRSFPSNMIAGMFGFEASKWKMFEANQTASVAPVISFSN